MVDAAVETISPKRLKELKDCVYLAVAKGGDSPCVEAEELMAIIQELEQQRGILDPIRKMVCEENSSITLFRETVTGRNSVPYARVLIANSRTKYREIGFEGTSYCDVLAKALVRCEIVE